MISDSKQSHYIVKYPPVISATDSLDTAVLQDKLVTDSNNYYESSADIILNPSNSTVSTQESSKPEVQSSQVDSTSAADA